MSTKKGGYRLTARKAYEFPKRRRSSPALTRLKGELAKAKKSASAARKKYKGNFFQGSGMKPMAALTITSGGAIAGASKVHFPTVAGFATPLVGGAALIAFSMFSKDDAIAGITGAIGAGMLASWASDATALTLIEMKKD